MVFIMMRHSPWVSLAPGCVFREVFLLSFGVLAEVP